jgi:hypothetical protein
MEAGIEPTTFQAPPFVCYGKERALPTELPPPVSIANFRIHMLLLKVPSLRVTGCNFQSVRTAVIKRSMLLDFHHPAACQASTALNTWFSSGPRISLPLLISNVF